jgi:LemA protein
MVVFSILVAAIAGAGIYYYNQFIRCDQLLQEAESGIDVQLKRRHDLVPNLVETVKGYTAHEKNVLENVTRLRTQAIDVKAFGERAGAENQLTQGLRSVFALAENYPDLKADGQFISLHQSLVQIEDELQMARRYYNGTARNFNVLAGSFPSSIVAALFGFKGKNFFEIETATDRAVPKVGL